MRQNTWDWEHPHQSYESSGRVYYLPGKRSLSQWQLQIFSYLKMTRTLTIQCLFILFHQKWLGMKLESMFHDSKSRPEVKDVRKNRRPTKGSHFKNKKNNIHLMVSHFQQHRPQHGSHDTDGCRLLSTEDRTAEKRFHCTVFSTCS